MWAPEHEVRTSDDNHTESIITYQIIIHYTEQWFLLHTCIEVTGIQFCYTAAVLFISDEFRSCATRVSPSYIKRLKKIKIYATIDKLACGSLILISNFGMCDCVVKYLYIRLKTGRIFPDIHPSTTGSNTKWIIRI